MYISEHWKNYPQFTVFSIPSLTVCIVCIFALFVLCRKQCKKQFLLGLRCTLKLCSDLGWGLNGSRCNLWYYHQHSQTPRLDLSITVQAFWIFMICSMIFPAQPNPKTKFSITAHVCWIFMIFSMILPPPAQPNPETRFFDYSRGVLNFYDIFCD